MDIIKEECLVVERHNMSEPRQNAHRKLDVLNEKGVAKALELIETIYGNPEFNEYVKPTDEQK